MIDALLPLAVLVSIVTLIVAIYILRSSRRSEALGEDRYELLRDQHERLEMLREERRMLTEQLEREAQERRQLTEYLKETDPRLAENLEERRRARSETRSQNKHKASAARGGSGGRRLVVQARLPCVVTRIT